MTVTSVESPALDRTAPVLVVHDVGDDGAGASWHDAMDASGWLGPITAPDLPGHGRQPAPVGGHYELGDAIFFLLPYLRELRDGPPPLVVGAGANGWTAMLIAAGAPCTGLVVVDGLGGPWRTPSEQVGRMAEWLRDVSDDPAAVGPPPARGTDPRLRHGVGSIGSRAMVERALESITAPALVIVTPASALPVDEVRDLAGRAGGSATVVELADATPPTVASAILDWVRAP